MAIQPTTDAPFGLQPNIAAGIGWIFGIIGGLIMLFGGGTNRFVKHAAAQSVVLWGGYFVIMIALSVLTMVIHILGLLSLLVAAVAFVAWIYTTIMGFTGKDVTLPVVGPLAAQIFASQLV